VLAYELKKEDDGTAAPAGTGAISSPTTTGATLALGATGSAVLTVDPVAGPAAITTPDYLVVSRFGGSLVMLCDAATLPGDSVGRFVGVASSIAQGGLAPQPLTDAAALAGLRLVKMYNCSYHATDGPQRQNTAADAMTASIEFDTEANLTIGGNTWTAAQLSDMLANGTSVAGSRFTAWRFTVDGSPRVVLLQRGDYDATNNVAGFLRLWLPE
jgi:hypothetical protein